MSWNNSTQAGFSLEGIGLTGYGIAGKKEIMYTAASPLCTLSLFFCGPGTGQAYTKRWCPFRVGVTSFCPNFCPNLRFPWGQDMSWDNLTASNEQPSAEGR